MIFNSDYQQTENMKRKHTPKPSTAGTAQQVPTMGPFSYRPGATPDGTNLTDTDRQELDVEMERLLGEMRSTKPDPEWEAKIKQDIELRAKRLQNIRLENIGKSGLDRLVSFRAHHQDRKAKEPTIEGTKPKEPTMADLPVWFHGDQFQAEMRKRIEGAGLKPSMIKQWLSERGLGWVVNDVFNGLTEAATMSSAIPTVPDHVVLPRFGVPTDTKDNRSETLRGLIMSDDSIAPLVEYVDNLRSLSAIGVMAVLCGRYDSTMRPHFCTLFVHEFLDQMEAHESGDSGLFFAAVDDRAERINAVIAILVNLDADAPSEETRYKHLMLDLTLFARKNNFSTSN